MFANEFCDGIRPKAWPAVVVAPTFAVTVGGFGFFGAVS